MIGYDFEIDKASVVPLYHQIQEILLEKIESDEFRAHDKLPSEHDLMDQFEISRATAQRVLNQLVNMGMAYRIQGKGTFVSDSSITYSVTASLSFSSEIIGSNKMPRSRLVDSKEIMAEDWLAEKLEVGEGSPIYFIQRIRYADDIPMAIQNSYLPEELVPGLINKKFHDGSLFRTLKNEYGLEVGTASEILKTKNASSREAKFLNISAGDAVFSLERITRLDSGEVIEFVQSVMRGDKSKFAIEISPENGNTKHITL